MKKILLFDIDGTLVSSDGAGRRSFQRAFCTLYGSDEACRFPFNGLTDPLIAKLALQAAGICADAPTITRLLDVYLRCLEEEMTAGRGYQALSGVLELLQQLSTLPSVTMGLGTGNLVAGADLKLNQVQLDQFFSFGGYGSDHEERAELLRVGAQRGAEQVGQSRKDSTVIVIGDTPKDVAAAHAIGATCVAVASGGHSIDELRACDPELAVTDMTDPRVLDYLS